MKYLSLLFLVLLCGTGHSQNDLDIDVTSANYKINSNLVMLNFSIKNTGNTDVYVMHPTRRGRATYLDDRYDLIIKANKKCSNKHEFDNENIINTEPNLGEIVPYLIKLAPLEIKTFENVRFKIRAGKFCSKRKFTFTLNYNQMIYFDEKTVDSLNTKYVDIQQAIEEIRTALRKERLYASDYDITDLIKLKNMLSKASSVKKLNDKTFTSNTIIAKEVKEF